GQAEAEQRLFDWRRLTDRSQHPGCDSRRTAAGLAPLEDGHPEPTLSGPPRDREADHAASYDGYIQRSGWVGHETLPPPALPGSGSDGRRIGAPPSQPALRAPVHINASATLLPDWMGERSPRTTPDCTPLPGL